MTDAERRGIRPGSFHKIIKQHHAVVFIGIFGGNPMGKMVYHYTHIKAFQAMAEWGHILPGDGFLVWLTENPHWEGGASASGPNQIGAGRHPHRNAIRLAMDAESVEGLEVFDVTEFRKIPPWAMFLDTLASVMRNIAGLEWYVTPVPVPLSICQVERWSGRSWVPYTGDIESTGDSGDIAPSAVLSVELIAAVVDQFPLNPHGVHGPSHWARVRENGLRLAAATGADTAVIELFALFHDCRRFNDGIDKNHGPRGAALAEDMRGRLLELDDERFQLLVEACRLHTVAKGHDNVTVQVCFDADRLDLPRVGVRVNPTRLCTEAARCLVQP